MTGPAWYPRLYYRFRHMVGKPSYSQMPPGAASIVLLVPNLPLFEAVEAPLAPPPPSSRCAEEPGGSRRPGHRPPRRRRAPGLPKPGAGVLGR